jgi:NADH:ubiquinone oxidoreductase subunit
MTIATRIYALLRGELVGTDEFGNRYYRLKGPSRRARGRKRRWVLYKGDPEASRVPPEWHAWLHHTSDAPLTGSPARERPWHKEHEPNRTGTAAAHLPSGHVLRGRRRAPATGDYEPWRPSSS